MSKYTKKIFEMLGVEPFEKFNIDGKTRNGEPIEYYITDDLEVCDTEYAEYGGSYQELIYILKGYYEISRISTTKKIKYLTEEDVKKICYFSKKCDVCQLNANGLCLKPTIIANKEVLKPAILVREIEVPVNKIPVDKFSCFTKKKEEDKK